VAEFRAGVVALLGRPNAGKSTLMNHVLGEKLAIVTAKPQTTRSRILGIHTTDTAQILFLDTPGLHASEKALNAALNLQVTEAGQGCDVALLLVDLRQEWGEDHAALLASLQARETPTFVVGTQLDRRGAAERPWPPAGVEAPSARISARTGEGVPALLESVVAALPVSPPLYPEDELSNRPLRWLVAEQIREAAFEALSQELPYALAVEVMQFDESRPECIKIRANVIIERASQKAMVIGKGGAMIKRIGSRARPPIEALLGSQVYLELFVRVEPKWAKRPQRLKELGYD
jgi:GTP-binding protein Era